MTVFTRRYDNIWTFGAGLLAKGIRLYAYDGISLRACCDFRWEQEKNYSYNLNLLVSSRIRVTTIEATYQEHTHAVSVKDSSWFFIPNTRFGTTFVNYGSNPKSISSSSIIQ